MHKLSRNLSQAEPPVDSDTYRLLLRQPLLLESTFFKVKVAVGARSLELEAIRVTSDYY